MTMLNFFHLFLSTHWVGFSPHVKADKGGCVTLIRKDAFRSNLTCSFLDTVPRRALSAVIAGHGQNLAVINENMIQRKNVIRNTVIKESDLDKLNLAEAIDTGKTSFGNPIYRTVEPVDLILVDNLQYAPGSQVCLLYVIQTHLG